MIVKNKKQSKHNLFKYSLKEAIINLIKIKSSDQCRFDTFFQRCRTVLFPFDRPLLALALA
jgi:preprotein translocase subunit SecB